jgi:translocation and assembly module TamA
MLASLIPASTVSPRVRILAQSAVKVIVCVSLALATATAAAQGIAYRVQVDAPKPLAEMLENNLDLTRFRGNARLDLEQLQRLVKAAPEQARTLVATEGYYTPAITAVLDTSGAEPVARVKVEPGPPVLVGKVDLVMQGFAATGDPFDSGALQQRWSLPVGALFRQAGWEDAKRNLVRQAVQARFPRTQLIESLATVDPATNRATLHVVLDSGPEMRLGDVRIEGLQRYPDSVITNINPLRNGDEYSEAALQAFQSRLQDTGYFSGVEVSADMSTLALSDEPAGVVTLPVLVRVTENKRKNVSAGLGYSTNTGNRAQLSYDDLSVFGLRLKSGITLETRKQAAHAQLFFPTKPNGYNDSVGTTFERNDLNGEVTSVSTVAVKRAWGSPVLERAFTLEYLNEHKTVTGIAEARISQSLPLTYSLTKRDLDSLLFPSKGFVISTQLGGALLPILTEQPFIRGSARLVLYRPLGKSATLILRMDSGALASRQKSGVPSTYLFRAGGDTSVRGYAYQQLGVQEGQGIVGGRYLLAGSAEAQYWFKPPWGAAVFYDAGNAGDVFKDLKPKSGYGLGLRWRSPVGPINVDAAYGRAVRKYRLHFSLGFTF